MGDARGDGYRITARSADGERASWIDVGDDRREVVDAVRRMSDRWRASIASVSHLSVTRRRAGTETTMATIGRNRRGELIDACVYAPRWLRDGLADEGRDRRD